MYSDDSCVRFKQWTGYWINLAHAAAAETPPHKPGRFKPAKRVAAEVAAELVIGHGLTLTSSRGPNNIFLKLASAIHGGKNSRPKRFFSIALKWRTP